MGQIDYCVKPYDEEILYSQMARMMSNCLEKKLTTALLGYYNNANYKATIDLPNHIDALYDSCYYKIATSSDSIIEKYTLYSFYHSFLTNDKRKRVRMLMKDSVNGNKIHSVVGINTSGFKRHRILRFCPVCIEEAKSIFGEPYWKRIHQIPGVLVCPTHNVFILEYQPSILELKPNLFIPASVIDCSKHELILNNNNNLLGIAKLFEDALLQRLPFDINTIDYRNSLSFKYEAGKHIKLIRLAEDFQNFYGQECLSFHFNGESNYLPWIRGIVRTPQRYFNPLKHILLFNFVQTLPNQLEMFRHSSEFDLSWECIIPTCSYASKKIRDKKVFYDASLKRNVCLVRCTCGLEYKAWFINNGAEHRLIKSISDYGDFWRGSVLRYVKEGKSIASIAKILNTSWGSVNRYVTNEKKGTNPKELLLQHRIKKSRVEWEKLLDTFDQFKVSNARKVNNALYKWLYNNDVEWLRVVNSLHRNTPVVPMLKLEWDKIDAELVSKVANAAEQLRRQKFKGKITKNIISKLILKEKNYFFIHKNQLPLCTKKLEDEIETKEQFQIRKSSLAINEIASQGERLSIAKVARAGKFVNPTDSTINFIYSEIDKINVA